jgi:hypothetical protein
MKHIVASCAIVAVLVGSFVIARPAPAKAGQGSAKAYRGTITLKRTNASADLNQDESAQWTVVLVNTADTPDKSAWQSLDAPTIVVAVNNVNSSNPTVLIPSRALKDTRAGVVLTISGSKKTYSLMVGPIKKIPATIKAGGETVNDFWDVQGQTASGVALPADASHLKGSFTVNETNHAKVELSWDLQLK